MAFIVVCLISVLLVNNVFGIPKYYMDKQCGKTLDLSELGEAVRLELTEGSSYRPDMDCTLYITSSNSADQFMLYFNSFSIEQSSGCYNDWLEVRDGRTSLSPYVSGLSGKQCGYYMSDTVRTTSGANLYLRFHSNSSWQYSGFEMMITEFHTGACNNAGEFLCSNGRCISDSLVCNGYNACGDYSDCVAVALAVGAIIAIVIGSIFVVFMVAAVSVICCRRRRRRLTGRVYQPVNVVATTTYGTGYNQSSQPVPQPYAAYPTGQHYQVGQQPPSAQYPNQTYKS